MKTNKPVFLLFALFIYSSVFAQKDTFLLDTLNFKVSFESEPEITFDTSYNEYLNENIYIQNFNLEVSDTTKPNFRYRISRMVYPSTFVHSDSTYDYIESIFYVFQAELENDSAMYFKNTTVIEKNGYPGKKFKWRNTDTGSLFQFQYFQVKNVLYQLVVASHDHGEFHSSINDFFDGFSISGLETGGFKQEQIDIPEIIPSYKVSFPEEPKQETRIVDSEYGRLPLHISIIESKNSQNMVYMVMETKYPENAIEISNKKELRAFYSKSLNGTAQGVSGKELGVKEIRSNGKMGVEGLYSILEGKAEAVYQIFYVNDSMYILGVVTTNGNSKNKQLRKFLSSFKI